METDWAENRAKIKDDPIRNLMGGFMDGAYSTGERDKFRTRLERGAQPNTTEIYITHRGVAEVYVNQYRDSTVWRSEERRVGKECRCRWPADQEKTKIENIGEQEQNGRGNLY